MVAVNVQKSSETSSDVIGKDAQSTDLLTEYFESKTKDCPGGDGEVLSELFRRESQRLHRIACSKGFSETDAEVIVSNCFYSLITREGNYDSEKASLGYLYKMFNNACYDFYRREFLSKRRSKNILLSEVVPAEYYRLGLAFEDLLVDDELSPPEKLLLEEARSVVQEVLNDFEDPKKKEVLSLIYTNGLKYREVAEYLGVSLGTVKSRIHQARREMLAHFSQYEYFQPEE